MAICVPVIRCSSTLATSGCSLSRMKRVNFTERYKANDLAAGYASLDYKFMHLFCKSCDDTGNQEWDEKGNKELAGLNVS